MKCTSFRCGNLNNNYCPECSHALYFGRGKDKNGKMWRWEFNPRFHRTTFIRENGLGLKNQPQEKSPAWPVFKKWNNRRIK